MGGSYGAPSPQDTWEVLRDYTNWLPSLAGATANAAPQFAQGQLTATQATQPAYDALNLQEAQRYALPLAQVGQQVTNSNALAGAQTNLNQLQGAGGQAAKAALDVARESNPNFYSVMDNATRQSNNLLNSISLNGLSPGEQNAVERSTNQGNIGSGNLGLANPTNVVSNALNFGGAFNSKLGILGNALGAANNTANTAQNTGFNPVSIALGQPNTSTMGNFGTSSFSPTNSATQNAAGSNATGFGTSLMGGQLAANNAATSGAYGLAQANSIPSYLGALPSYS